MVPALFRPKRPAWLRGTLIAIVAITAVFVVWSRQSPWRPGRAGGLAFGAIAATIFYVDGLYTLRRRLMFWPLGTGQHWLQFHIYGGTVALVLTVFHTGLHWPHGQFGWWLLIASIWSVASGAFGVLLQKWLAAAMTSKFSVEAIAARMGELAERALREADQVMAGSPDALAQAYAAELRPVLDQPQPDWGYLFDWGGLKASRMAPLARIEPFLADSEGERVATLRSILDEKLQLDAHLSHQRVLRLWLVLHVPAALLLLGLVTVHLFAAWLL